MKSLSKYRLQCLQVWKPPAYNESMISVLLQITRRYAEFAAGILSVMSHPPIEKGVVVATNIDDDAESAAAADDAVMGALLTDLQGEVERFILRVASSPALQQGSGGRKGQLIFLINNYDMVLSILSERSGIASKEADSFKDLLQTRNAEYVEQVLFPHFGSLIRFIQRAEPLLVAGDERALTQEAGTVASLVTSFNNGWKGSLDAIHEEVLRSFPNFKNGTAILQQTLTALVQYYHRFHKILGEPVFASHPDRARLINVHQLMVEVKKYKPNF